MSFKNIDSLHENAIASHALPRCLLDDGHEKIESPTTIFFSQNGNFLFVLQLGSSILQDPTI
jgi:hypothetical protein